MASLPFYVAMTKGFFHRGRIGRQNHHHRRRRCAHQRGAERAAFAFIGGPEHNAFAVSGGADLRGVVTNDRATAYFVAKKGMGPAPSQSMPEYIKGKSIAVSLYGGTPNSILPEPA